MGIPFIFSNFEVLRNAMSDPSSTRDHFIDQAEALVVENLSNEQFGVSELAAAMNMSRSNLLRKIKKRTKLSASQFIRQVRLEQGMELLRDSSLTVSEISYQVGFGSTSYFIKCFREHYGYPPGAASKNQLQKDKVVEEVQVGDENLQERNKKSATRKIVLIGVVVALVLIVSALLFDRKSNDP